MPLPLCPQQVAGGGDGAGRKVTLSRPPIPLASPLGQAPRPVEIAAALEQSEVVLLRHRLVPQMGSS